MELDKLNYIKIIYLQCLCEPKDRYKFKIYNIYKN